MSEGHVVDRKYEPPTVEDLGTLEELTLSGNNVPGGDGMLLKT